MDDPIEKGCSAMYCGMRAIYIIFKIIDVY